METGYTVHAAATVAILIGTGVAVAIVCCVADWLEGRKNER